MRPTRRGWTVVAVVAVAVASGQFFGARALNAIAAPAVVALIAAVVQVRWISKPAIERDLPERGHRDTTVRVRLHADAGRAFGARVHDRVGDGLDATGNDRRTTLPGEGDGVAYDLHLRERGRREVGPVRVVARDVLGLVTRTFRYADRDRVLVLPRVHSLVGPGRDDLVRRYGGTGDQRREFEHLREYERGDPLRDIEWKKSAEQPGGDLIVKAFAAEEDATTVEVAAESRLDCDDEMADAAASIVVALLESGVHVGLTTADGRLPPDGGDDHRERMLDHLATTGGGRIPGGPRSQADVLVAAAPDEVRVVLDDLAYPFDELTGGRAEPGAERSPPADGAERPTASPR